MMHDSRSLFSTTCRIRRAGRCFAAVFGLTAAGLVVPALTLQAAEHDAASEGKEVSTSAWPQFRGPFGNGIVSPLRHPSIWSEAENLAWKVTMNGAGWSSPVVADGRVFLSSAESDAEDKPKDMSSGSWSPMSFGLGSKKPPSENRRFTVSSFDLQSGKPVWRTVVADTRPGLAKHPSNTYATESPVTDGKHVVAFFGACGKLACLDGTDGRVLWDRDFPVHKMSAGFGTGSSLLIHDGKVYVQRCNDEASGLHVLRVSDGSEIWSAELPGTTSWSTPYLWRTSYRNEVIIGGSGSLTAYEPGGGEQLWRVTGIPASFTASPVADGDRLIFGVNSPFTTSPMYALRAGASGEISARPAEVEDPDNRPADVSWFMPQSAIGMASPVVAHGLVYVPCGSGKLRVIDARTGDEVFRARLPQGKQLVASPWTGNGKVFLLDEEGKTFVIRVGRTFELERVNRIDDTFWSTPAVAGANLLLRGVNALYCIREKSDSKEG